MQKSNTLLINNSLLLYLSHLSFSATN